MIMIDIPKIKNIKTQAQQNIYIEYEDGISWTISLKPSNTESIYNRFLNYDYFNNAKIDTKHNTIIRDEDLDVDWYACYLEILKNK